MALDVLTTFRTEFPSSYASVAQARRVVGSFAQTCGFSPPEISDIVLAVGEACSNAVEHGHSPNGRLGIQASFDDGVLHIEIADEGPGIDGRAARVEVESEKYIGRGRGIPIMRALMDAVVYKTGESGTTVLLDKRLSAGCTSESCGEALGVDACDPSQPR